MVLAASQIHVKWGAGLLEPCVLSCSWPCLVFAEPWDLAGHNLETSVFCDLQGPFPPSHARIRKDKLLILHLRLKRLSGQNLGFGIVRILTQASLFRSSTQRMTSRAAKTRKASETCNTVGPSKSLYPEAQEWICDKIIAIRNEAESLMSSIPPDSRKYHLKGSMTFHQSPPVPLDDRKNKSVPAPSGKASSYLYLA